MSVRSIRSVSLADSLAILSHLLPFVNPFFEFFLLFFVFLPTALFSLHFQALSGGSGGGEKRYIKRVFTVLNAE